MLNLIDDSAYEGIVIATGAHLGWLKLMAAERAANNPYYDDVRINWYVYPNSIEGDVEGHCNQTPESVARGIRGDYWCSLAVLAVEKR